ncbi:hypothetical protein AVEN_268405-1 [Araneus ventricosus]|uniref:Uncharacterized protein n=1 Tax=Araneus ventricosus TaxID=182803 RepID=A0A4Y2DW96_ARAVE|nr:hypothetical protein AVEN_268405-1 [Araneus ventricosus]
MDIRNLLKFLEQGKNTKRFVLQAAGRIFDPLGLVSPFTVRLKCMFQELWQRKIPWDDEIPVDLQTLWLQWCSELPQLSKLLIPRNILECLDDAECKLELHTFSDASPKAYGAAVYLRTIYKDQIKVHLITAKTRVAPLKKISLPRLELLGALVASRLATEVKKVLERKDTSKMFFWTDSQIMLYWIKGSSHKWKQLVGNRVKEIQSLSDKESWFHSSGLDNPADLLTRGISVDCLLGSAKWWTGPSFLFDKDILHHTPTCEVPEDMYSSELKKSANCELKDSIVTLMYIHDNSLFVRILKISNDYTKLLRVTSFIFRFIHNSRFSKVRKTGPLTYSEVSNAEHWFIKGLQRAEFSEEIKRLEKGESSLPKNKLASLNVFLDENKILRVGGRLTHSDLQFDSKFPIILHSKHPLTNIILRYFHLKYFHLGSQALLYHVRQGF